jgi:hypothetical protein
MTSYYDRIAYLDKRVCGQIPLLVETYGDFIINKEYNDNGIKIHFRNDTLRFTYETTPRYPFTPPKITVFYKGGFIEMPMNDWSPIESLSCIYTQIVEIIKTIDEIQNFRDLQLSDVIQPYPDVDDIQPSSSNSNIKPSLLSDVQPFSSSSSNSNIQSQPFSATQYSQLLSDMKSYSISSSDDNVQSSLLSDMKSYTSNV